MWSEVVLSNFLPGKFFIGNRETCCTVKNLSIAQHSRFAFLALSKTWLQITLKSQMVALCMFFINLKDGI